MYCKHCGLNIAPGSVCCPRCGRPTTQEESTAVYVLKSIPTAILIWLSCVLVMAPICSLINNLGFSVFGLLVAPVAAVVLVFLKRYDTRMVYQRFWFWALIFCVALTFAGIVMPDNEAAEDQSLHATLGASEETKEQTQPTETTQYTMPIIEPVPDDGPIVVGNTIAYNGITVQLIEVTENRGGNYVEPDSGNVFVLCEFEVINNTQDDIYISTLVSFEAYFDDYLTDTSFSAEMSTNKATLDGTVAPGKKIRGVVGFEVPSTWKELEIRFTPDFWFGDEYIFTYKK